PGPGGFYDDPGNAALQPHLVRGLPFDQDPASLQSAKTGFRSGDPPERSTGLARVSWLDHAESLNDQPLKLRYTDLDPTGRYKVRVVYCGDSMKKKIRLVANDALEIHPFIVKEWPIKPVEFDVPAAATQSGEL